VRNEKRQDLLLEASGNEKRGLMGLSEVKVGDFTVTWTVMKLLVRIRMFIVNSTCGKPGRGDDFLAATCI
jgi:hypothetical protein